MPAQLFTNPRAFALLIALSCAALMGIALYMQYVMELAPCALCMMQRVWVVVAGAIALLAVLHNPSASGYRRYAIATAAACVIGAGFSIRQLYLQALPADEVPACGPDFEYMLDAFPFAEVLKAMVMGTGNCALVDWSLFGISIAGWVLVAFAALIGLALLQARATREPV